MAKRGSIAWFNIMNPLVILKVCLSCLGIRYLVTSKRHKLWDVTIWSLSHSNLIPQTLTIFTAHLLIHGNDVEPMCSAHANSLLTTKSSITINAHTRVFNGNLLVKHCHHLPHRSLVINHKNSHNTSKLHLVNIRTKILFLKELTRGVCPVSCNSICGSPLYCTLEIYKGSRPAIWNMVLMIIVEWTFNSQACIPGGATQFCSNTLTKSPLWHQNNGSILAWFETWFRNCVGNEICQAKTNTCALCPTNSVLLRECITSSESTQHMALSLLANTWTTVCHTQSHFQPIGACLSH
mmetsp:Transcript_34769/g.71036  ORF Transcript_34769/g.71036 Transcript_34769/m.71036 type:complete len:294 (+) Transcript_34769:444-1325(+)